MSKNILLMCIHEDDHGGCAGIIDLESTSTDPEYIEMRDAVIKALASNDPHYDCFVDAGLYGWKSFYETMPFTGTIEKELEVFCYN